MTMISDRHLDPPDDCDACEEYHVYRNGLCWKCWTEAQEIKGQEREESRRLTKMEEES